VFEHGAGLKFFVRVDVNWIRKRKPTTLSAQRETSISAGMNTKSSLPRCVLSLFFLLSLGSTQAAPPNLSADEKTRYERGAALNKEIAHYGLDTLRHYKARVVSIKSAASGKNGADIELRTQTALVHNGELWFHSKEQPITPRTLRWHWPDNRPVPVCPGFWIDAYADAEDRVQRISLEPGISDMSIYVVALRKIGLDGRWEICIATSDARDKKSFIALQPDYLNVEDRVFQVEWNAKHGLAISNFRVKYAEGDEGNHESEGQAKNWPGWPLANVPGKYVRPGRDGWKGYWTLASESNQAWQDGGMVRLIPAAQYIGTSNVYAGTQ
jgi:hypothetical protein